MKFNKDSYDALVKNIETHSAVEALVDRARKYVDSVVIMNIYAQLGQFRDDDYMDRLLEKDRDRKACHDLAIIRVVEVNRECSRLDIPFLFNGDETDRCQIADFCLDVVNVLFTDGRRIA